MLFIRLFKNVQMQGAHSSQFDKLTVTLLTMTIRKPVLSPPKEGAQRNAEDGRFSTAC